MRIATVVLILIFKHMKLSLPIINTIRFDTDFKILVFKNGAEAKSDCKGYCFDELDKDGNKRYGVGIRIKLNLYIDSKVNEVVGYASETESIVLNHSSAMKDMDMLKRFSEDVFKNIKRNLQDEMVGIDLKKLEFPDSTKLAYYLSEGLIQLGLYK